MKIWDFLIFLFSTFGSLYYQWLPFKAVSARSLRPSSHRNQKLDGNWSSSRFFKIYVCWNWIQRIVSQFTMNATEMKIIQRMTIQLEKGIGEISEALSAGISIMDLAISRISAGTCDHISRKAALEICDIGIKLFNAALTASANQRANKYRGSKRISRRRVTNANTVTKSPSRKNK